MTKKFPEFPQSADKYFDLTENPETIPLKNDNFDRFMYSIEPGNDDVTGSKPSTDPSKPVSVDPVPPGIPNNDELLTQKSENGPARHETGDVRARVSGDPDGVSMTENEENAPYSGNTDGYEHALRAFYPFAFRFLSRKFNRDMELTESETTELTEATLPLMRKYVGRDFTYGEEVRFALTIAGLWSKKLSESETKPYPKEGKMEEKPETQDEKTVEARKEIFSQAGPILDKFQEMGIEYDDLEPIKLDDLHYQKLKKFIEKSGQGIEIDRENAEKIAAVFKTMGLDPLNVIDHFENLPPELLSNFIRTQT